MSRSTSRALRASATRTPAPPRSRRATPPTSSRSPTPARRPPFVAGGAILPVSDFVQYMPNFQDKVEKWGLQADVDNLRQADGKFYLLPGVSEIVVPQYSYVVRKDIWDELGLSYAPKTFDDFQKDLEKVHKAYPPDKTIISDEFNDPPDPPSAARSTSRLRTSARPPAGVSRPVRALVGRLEVRLRRRAGRVQEPRLVLPRPRRGRAPRPPRASRRAMTRRRRRSSTATRS